MNNRVISNTDIRETYERNSLNESKVWMENLFNELDFLVKSRLKKYKNFSKDSELKQELYLALWKAIKTYDCHKNFDFYRWSSWHLSKSYREFSSQKNKENSINVFIQSASYEEEPRQEKLIFLKQIFVGNNILSNREKQIVWGYYLEGETLKEIAKKVCLTPERVRQIRDISLSKIREN